MKTNALVLSSIMLAACGNKASKLPPKPINGAPVAFVAGTLKPGTDGSIAVKAYNFSDKRVVQYVVLLRYQDASGALVKVPFGIDSYKDVGFTSFSGKSFACNPKSWCSYTIDADVPANAAKVEILATSLGAMKDETTIDDKPLFQAESMMEWPSNASARR